MAKGEPRAPGRLAGMLLLAAFALLSVTWLGPGTAHATFSGENGKIALARDGVIWTMNADGTGATFVTCRDEVMGVGRRQRLPAAFPVWSPDGRRIAFRRVGRVADSSPRWLLVLNPNSSQDLLSRDGESPTWSPDARRIGFALSHRPWLGVFSTILVANRDGSGRTRVGEEGDWSPAWSPDGETIAFSRGIDRDIARGADIWAVNPDGGDATLLAEAAHGPAWSPDGQKIAFMRYERGDDGFTYNIWTMNADGSGEARLTDSPLADLSPHWSPDGETIAFHRFGDIWVVNANGNDARRLTHGFNHAWSPDGRKIAFMRSASEFTDEIWVIDADGSDARRLVRGSSPDWQPVPPGAGGVPIPSQFCFTALRRNTNRGISRLVVEVSGPGRVILRQRPGVRRFAQAHREAGPGRVVLRVRPRGRARQRLNRRTNRLPVRVQVTYKPWEGAPRTRGGRMWLVKR